WSFGFAGEEHPNKYNSFVKEETIVREVDVVDEETQEPTGEKKVVEETVSSFYYGTADFDYEAEKVKIDQCLKRVAQDDVFSVQEWMDDIRAKSRKEDIIDQVTEDLNV
ncbi:MAG: hypothetical protein DRP42_06760, partial [Tenericutes bacterium]